MHSVWTYSYKISNSKSIANCSREDAFITKNGQNSHFQKFIKKSINQISQNCDDELYIMFGSIFIKYQTQNPSQAVAEEVNLSRK